MFSGDIRPVYPDPQKVLYPDHIPYRGPVPGGLHEGKLIEIKGHIPFGADRFQINLCTGLDPNSDRPLHISVRFHPRGVVLNSFERNSYGMEENNGIFPFFTGKDFTLMILVDPAAYRIAVNSTHCWQFPHRISFSRVSSIFIDGSVQIERIEYIDKITPNQLPGTCIPSFPTYPGPGGPREHHKPNQLPGTCIPSFPIYPGPGGPREHHKPYQQPGICIPSFPTYPGPGGPRDFPMPGMPPQLQPSICPTPSMGIQPAVCPAVPTSFIVPPPENQSGICPRPSGGHQSNSNLAPVYNPSIPYAYPIYGGLKPGMMIYISGRPSANPHKFTINLQSGTSPYPPPDIAFHFDIRFHNFTVVRNSRANNVWNSEETMISHFPFQPAVNFDMIIKVEHDKYMIALNGQHFLEFRHRLTPLSRFDTLCIENDIVVSSIRFA